jgi:CRISPR-associated protein Cas5t
MLGVRVTVPVACFRKGLAREYLETEPIPPPATCYGFLLSLVGETSRRRHLWSRVAPALLQRTEQSVVLRTVWRVKKTPLGSPGNTRPDYQQLLTGATRESPFIELLVWLDSGDEAGPAPRLEERVRVALDPARRGQVARFGGLSLGESAHLVDEVNVFEAKVAQKYRGRGGVIFVTAERGRLTLPVWVDHVGSAGTRYATGDLEETDLNPPPRARMPLISDE